MRQALYFPHFAVEEIEMRSHLPKVPQLVSEGIRLDAQVVCPQGPCDHAMEQLARERALECAKVKGLA